MTVQEVIEKINDVLSSDYHFDETLGYQLTSDDFAWLEAAKQALEQQGQKCSFGVGVKVLLDGVHELDPCIYEEIERYRNVTVIVSRCKRCGNIDISWIRQENTEVVDDIYD